MMELCHLSTREKDQVIGMFRGHDVEMLKLTGDANFISHLKELSGVGENIGRWFGNLECSRSWTRRDYI